ncbi:ubiquinol--cytochrome-c reductase subunit 7 [Rhodotorula paludigena]|uniref:ubiquinol--cytochrome-c reductase subunit 7 n=1 Tax=Rhodotorula paludigena TaxID=86838 RepID=UPI00317140C1
MDPTAPSNGSSAGGYGTRRAQREASFHPMATDSDSDGGVSDGDPPDYTGGPRPAPIAPPPDIPGHPSSTHGRKRAFDELEDIVFSNPKSFVTIAKEIADSRNVPILVGDDRTHKVTSAYMHVVCAYRRAGCPFILKLTKAKEGGWIIKGAKGPDIDAKQRSSYRCRHPSGARPDMTVGTPASDWLSSAPGKSTSHPEAGTKPRAAKPRATSQNNAPPPGAWKDDPDLRAIGAQYETEFGKARGGRSRGAGAATSAGTGGRMGRGSNDSGSGSGAAGIGSAIDADRALAPPFQRALDIQAQIVPVLPVSPLRNGASSAGAGAGGGTYYQAPGSSPRIVGVAAGRAREWSYDARSSTQSAAPPDPSAALLPLVAVADPSALPEWTALLTQLGDPSLIPLARVLASPLVSATPASFFSEPRELREKLLEALPEQATGIWPKLRLQKRMREGGEQAWREMQREQSGADALDQAGSGAEVDGTETRTATKDEDDDEARANGLDSARASPGATADGEPAALAFSAPLQGSLGDMDVDGGLNGRDEPVIVASPPPKTAGQLASGMGIGALSALGISFAKQVKASRGFLRFVKPLADRYANLADYRSHGLKYDDLLIEESANVQKALGRLSERESYDRAFRHRTAHMCAIAHEELPKAQWVKPTEDVRYLKPHVLEVEAEAADRAAFDHATRA